VNLNLADFNRVNSAAPSLAPYFHPQRVHIFSTAVSKHDALTTLAQTFADPLIVGDHRAWVKAIFDREEVTSTGLGNGIAIPHAQHHSIPQFAFALGISSGIDFIAKDSKPVQLMVMMAAPIGDRPTYLKMLANVAARLYQPPRVAALLSATSKEAMVAEFLR
jgi:mannitol/fructose-specific phosphotransferase system IIA component (Ntr-type)